MNGVICINKPKDMTSFDVVAMVRYNLHEKKAGHAGTLDPMATGVLPVFLGETTKAIPIIENHDKKYTARLRLGVITDSGDITGKVIETRPVNVSTEDVKKAAKAFVGQIKQVPPMYSAIKVNGRHLYELAREGKEIERQARDITIYSLDVRSKDEATGDYIIEVACSKGTYIRTLCEDIGNKLGCGATMAALERTSALGFNLNDCISIDQLKSIANGDNIDKYILNVESVFKDYQKANISQKQAIRFRNGGKLATDRIAESLQDGICSIYYNNLFIGIGNVDNQSKEISIRGHFNRDVEI